MNTRIPSLMLASALVFAATQPASAEPVPGLAGHALEQPALALRSADHQVMLAVTRAGNRLVAVGERGVILLSSDQGQHWNQARKVPVSVSLTSVAFATEQVGYATGHAGVVLKTSDGGEVWHQVLDGRQAAELTLAASRSSGDSTRIDNAEWLLAEGPNKPFLDLRVMSPDHLLVIGAYGLALESRDGGGSWSSMDSALMNDGGMHLYSIRQRRNRVLITGEQGLVRYSRDYGNTFVEVYPPYGGSFFTAELLPSEGFVLAGMQGQAWYSPDAGSSWIQLQTPLHAAFISSVRLADDSVLLSSQAGMLMKVAGERLMPVGDQAFPAAADMTVQSDSEGNPQLLLAGFEGLQRVALNPLLPDGGSR